MSATLTHGLSALGDAEFVGFLEDGSDEWHAQRGTGIGSSEIASAARVPGAFKSRYILWAEKLGYYTPPEPDEKLRRMFRMGHLMEDVLDRILEEERPDEISLPAGSWRHVNDPTALLNPDRLVWDTVKKRWRGREYKNSRLGFEGDEPPLRYIAQAEWCRGSLGFEEWDIAAVYSGSDYRLWTVRPGPLGKTEVINHDKGTSELVDGVSYARDLLPAHKEFVQLLRTKTPPPLDGGRDTFDHMKSKFLGIDIDKDVELDLELAIGLHEHDEAIKHHEEQLLLFKSRVLEKMEDAKGAYIKDGTKEVRVAYRQAARKGSDPTLYLSRTRAVKDALATAKQATAA